MNLSLVSPPSFEEREIPLLGEFLSLGLGRYHVRKPGCHAAQLRAWLERVPPAWRSRMVLHQCHELVGELGLLGRHFRGGEVAPEDPGDGFISRACHDPSELPAALGHHNALLLSPVFPSLSKPGYTPRVADWGLLRLQARLQASGPRRTELCALGGIDETRIGECHSRGFTGVAVLGAVWLAPDPVDAFARLLSATSLSDD